MKLIAFAGIGLGFAFTVTTCFTIPDLILSLLDNNYDSNNDDNYDSNNLQLTLTN